MWIFVILFDYLTHNFVKTFLIFKFDVLCENSGVTQRELNLNWRKMKDYEKRRRRKITSTGLDLIRLSLSLSCFFQSVQGVVS